MGFFQHPSALVETDEIGEGTRIWAFAHVMAGAQVGSGCNIGDHVFIENGVTIGDLVTVKNGVSIWEKMLIEDRVFIGPNAVFTNDLWPRSRAGGKLLPTRICYGATIGANATVLCGITIARFALVGAGAVVTRDVPEHTLMVGNPARAVGYVCECARSLSRRGEASYECGDCGKKYSLAAGRGLRLRDV
ncbi:MAG: acyltransferase [Acidobacteriota bacterium]